jgi:CBS domain-containing protein
MKKVKEIMTRTVEMVRPQDTLQDAAGKMKTHDVGVLPVADGGKVVGMVTDRDIVLRGTAAGKDPGSTHVEDVMTASVVTCYESDNIDDVARTMKSHQIRRVVILDDAKRVVGIVSLGDLAVETRDDERKGEILEEVSEPTGNRR